MAFRNALLPFKPAELKTGKEWFVQYYIVEPGTEKFIRKKIKVNHIKQIQERKRFAKFLIDEINQKLYSGWNPFTEKTVEKGYNQLTKCIQVFIQQKQKELRPDSMRSYVSFIERFKSWLDKNQKIGIYSVNFNKSHATDFMNYLYRDPNISSKTWNNYLSFFRSFWNWLVENRFAAENVFADISKKTQTDKTRTVIPASTREQIKNYLEKTDYDFMIATMLVFHCLIRPKEISMLKPKDFLLHRQVIRIAPEVSKNKTERLATIPDALMPYLVAWNFNGATNDEYIFGTNFKPGKEPVCSRRFAKKWDKLR